MKKSNKDKCEDVIQSMFNFKDGLVKKGVDENGNEFEMLEFETKDEKSYKAVIEIPKTMTVGDLQKLIEIISKGDKE